jgi:hypothetical protein
MLRLGLMRVWSNRQRVDGVVAIVGFSALLWTGWFAPGCAGQSTTTRNGVDSMNAGGTAGAGNAVGGSAGLFNGGAAGDAPACPSTHTGEPASAVTIVFRNTSTEAVYIPRQQCSAFFRISEVEPVIGGSFPRQLTVGGDPIGRGSALPVCSALTDACSSSGTQNGCSFDLIELGSGEEASFEWSGALHPIVSIPEACREGECEISECGAERAARPARYLLHVQALSWLPECESDGCSCQWVSGGTCCEPGSECPCQPYDDGTCRHRSYSPELGFLDATDLDFELEFEYPSVDPVLVVFE